jgi:OOP family OmpA-OmpF porin
MGDPAVGPVDDDGRDLDARDPAEDLAAVRAIIVGPEQRAIEAFRARLADPAAQARDIAAVLPQALQLRAHDADLARALAPPVEDAITASIRRNPKPLAEALFPVMGPAIRKAVAASLLSMVESFNRTLEHSLSWRSLKWRVEAVRTGRSFGEVVLLHTLLFRVEQVFLIDRTSGLLLQHVHAGVAGVRDADMVSGMLTAIRDFVSDSFRVSDKSSLDAFRVGDLSVWIEHGPRAILAAVIRGTPPPALRATLQQTLETIHFQLSDALEHFEGDASPFEAARPELDACLRAEYRRDEAPPRRLAPAVVAALVVGVLAVWAGLTWRDRQRLNGYLDLLRAQPGIVVVSAERRGGKFVVSGLRDRRSASPDELLRAAALDPADVEGRWRPYQALDPPIVLAAAGEVLQPPPSVSLELTDGVLRVSGRAPAAWLLDARARAPLIPGVVRVDASAALDDEIRGLVERVGAAELLFVRGTSRLAPGHETAADRLEADIVQLDALLAAADRRAHVAVVGHTDSDGGPESNVPLSLARAESVQARLVARNLTRLAWAVRGAGSSEPVATAAAEPDKQRNRRVSLRIALE